MQSGIALINNVSLSNFTFVLSRIIERNVRELITPDELKTLQESTTLSDNELQLLVHSISYIFKQASKFILKPTTLHKHLTEELKFEADKAEEFVKQWTTQTKKDFEDLENRYKLEDVSWQLNVQAASSVSSKEKIPNAKIQFHLGKVKDSSKDNVTLDLNEEELVQLYNTLENIQIKLDAINSSK